MMKLSTMSRIVFACREQGEPPMADALADLWFPDHGPLRFVRISANCVFRFEAEGRAFFLRFNSDTEREVKQLDAEVRFVNYLAENGVCVARPVLSLSGSYVESMQSTAGTLHATVFEALPGRICYEVADLTPGMTTRWGYALGKLHRTALGYTNCEHRQSWRTHLEFIRTYLPKEEHAAWSQLEQAQAKLNELPSSGSDFGLIHYDFELDNVVWDGDTPGVLDFDDCAFYWHTADIAFALRDLFDNRADRVDPDSEAYRLFIEGYRRGRGADPGDLHLIPLFLRLHNLTTFAKLVRTLEDGKQQAEPEWMDDLRAKLLNKLQSYREALAAYQISDR